MENEKSTTIDELARMIKKGFDDTAKKADVGLRFDKIENRLDRIEKLLIEDHQKRIEKLEDEMKELKAALALK